MIVFADQILPHYQITESSNVIIKQLFLAHSVQVISLTNHFALEITRKLSKQAGTLVSNLFR